MQDPRPLPTPMVYGLQLYAFNGELFDDPTLYCKVVGGLQYVTITRPGIAFAVNRVSQYMHKSLQFHWKAVKCIL